jgi:sugar phosphate isomerase/epimerase
MNRLVLEFISVLAMQPVEFIELAAELGCGGVGLALAPFTANPHGYRNWSLRSDAGLRRETIAALRDNQVNILNGEGFLIRAGSEICDSATDMDVLAELGTRSVNIISLDPDLSRSTDQLGQFAEMAAARGMQSTLEYMAGMAIGSLSSAIDVVRAVNQPGLGVMLDCMHLSRSGGTAADVAAAPPGAITYLQLCDVKQKPIDSSYGEEARHNRLALGAGDLPLADIVAALPTDITVGIEVPMLALAETGAGPKERLAASVAYTKRLLGGN